MVQIGQGRGGFYSYDVLENLNEAAVEGATDFETLRRHVRQAAGRFVNERTKRRPMIVPVVMEV